jgi:hypothetical protein
LRRLVGGAPNLEVALRGVGVLWVVVRGVVVVLLVLVGASQSLRLPPSPKPPPPLSPVRLRVQGPRCLGRNLVGRERRGLPPCPALLPPLPLPPLPRPS